MSSKNISLLVKNPLEALRAAREGISPRQVENFIRLNDLVLEPVLESLDISRSSYFQKKSKSQVLSTEVSEKFLRLARIMGIAKRVLGEDSVKQWLKQPVPSLGNECPFDLLDTEIGSNLVEQAILQIEHGIYG